MSHNVCDPSIQGLSVCTFTKTKRNYLKQPIYRCRTCKLEGTLGMCYVCVTECHQGHDVLFAGNSTFFCDCGDKGESLCRALRSSKDRRNETTNVKDRNMDIGSMVCTFVDSKTNYVCQSVYRCRTCKLEGNLGMCHVCATKCHHNHDIYYAHYGGFFCDCGERGDSVCKALGNSNKTRNFATVVKAKKDSDANKIFECPVCLNYMSGSIHMCERGHNVCDTCKAQISECPLCRGTFTGARNLGMESLGNALEISCDDCDESVVIAALNNHRETCPMKDYKCPFESHCAWIGKYWNICDHSQDKHPQQTLIGATHMFEHTNFSNGGCDLVSLIEAERNLFLFHRNYNREKDTFQAVVKIINQLGHLGEKCFFQYTLKFTGANGDESIVFKKMVRPGSETVDNIYKRNNGITLHMNQAASFVQTGSLNYRLKIKEIKK